MDQGGGVSRFCVENFSSHSAETSVGRILYSFIFFGYRKSLHARGLEYQDFLSKVFCVTVPKFSVGETFFAALISGIEKVWIRGGVISNFRRKLIVSQCRKLWQGNPLVFHKICLPEKVYELEGWGCQDFPWKIFCRTVPRTFVGEPFSVSLFWVPKNFG